MLKRILSSNPAMWWMILSALAFSGMGVFVKLANRLPVHEIVFARAIISFFLSYGIVRKLGLSPLGNNRKLLIARGVSGFLGLMLVVTALTKLPLAEATVLQYLHPITTALLAWLALGERPGKNFWWAAALGISGTFFVTRPTAVWQMLGLSTAHGLPLLPVLIALGGACMSSVAYVIVRRLSHTENPHVIVMYFPMITIPCVLPLLVWQHVTPTAGEWIFLLGVGLCTQVGQIALTKGLANAQAAHASAYSYIQVVFAAIFGIALFGDPIYVSTIAGALTIFLAIFLVSRSRMRKTG